MSYYGLIPAAGNGFRFGADVPKQYLLLNGIPVLQHSLDRLRAGFPLRHTYVVVAPDDHWFEQKIAADSDVTALRCGGRTRSESVRNALAQMRGVESDDWIVVHDAVRPCLGRAESARLQQELAGDGVGGFLAVPVADTLKRLDGEARVVGTQARDSLWRAQTPQMFRFGVLHRALAGAVEAWTDEAQAVEAMGLPSRAISGSACNVKVTFPDDLLLASAILAGELR
jgi:2-C-methyl-D-erythritol 4-phosphate cytidylyltransferase